MRLKAFAAAAATTALVTAGSLSASAHSGPVAPASDQRATPAPLYRSANALPGRYIVTLSNASDPFSMVDRFGVKPLFTYKSAVRGFAAMLSPGQLEAVRSTLGVEAVEQDAKVTAVGSSGSDTRSPSASWGLDRIDQRDLPLDSDYTSVGSGAGATAYILDTGIEYAHAEFGGRATFGYDAIGDGRAGKDCQGHGTHVAGTVGGKTYGVARKANLVSVRVLDCQGTGTWSGVVAGLDWVAANAKQPAVLNASLGGSKSVVVNNAATALSDSGVLPVIAAGNDSVDACTVSPASALRVVTVGASSSFDAETDFSNFGGCLSLYAPGAAIVSAKLGGGSVALNGTSMASPHVAGVAALYKAAHPTAPPAEVAGFLDAESTKDALTGIGQGSPNRLLFTAGL
ncbi:S8 family peptidase [Streptomyces sp. NBC_01142]|uniref:S8 family peptidase n=1 Tax=Streptomyces sp. NBC_01142 TaxID=2975865 RepID=UPI00224D28D7|nr:S8 family peptidase [Streptomyces sp. NBC_01142]MCX4819591.1 S8 family peptidase [Streptomyces sp. NBC_01142]